MISAILGRFQDLQCTISVITGQDEEEIACLARYKASSEATKPSVDIRQRRLGPVSCFKDK